MDVDDHASLVTLVNDLQAQIRDVQATQARIERTEGDVLDSDVHTENTADLAKQLTELRNNVLGSTQRENDDYLYKSQLHTGT